MLWRVCVWMYVLVIKPQQNIVILDFAVSIAPLSPFHAIQKRDIIFKWTHMVIWKQSADCILALICNMKIMVLFIPENQIDYNIWISSAENSHWIYYFSLWYGDYYLIEQPIVSKKNGPRYNYNPIFLVCRQTTGEFAFVFSELKGPPSWYSDHHCSSCSFVGIRTCGVVTLYGRGETTGLSPPNILTMMPFNC